MSGDEMKKQKIKKQDDTSIAPNDVETGEDVVEETDNGDIMEEVMNKLNEVVELVGELAKANKAMLDTQRSRDDALTKKFAEALKEAMKRPEDVHSKEDLPESGEEPKVAEDAEAQNPPKKDDKKEPYDRGGQPAVEKNVVEKNDTPEPEADTEDVGNGSEPERFIDEIMKGKVDMATLEETVWGFRKARMDEVNKIRGV